MTTNLTAVRRRAADLLRDYHEIVDESAASLTTNDEEFIRLAAQAETRHLARLAAQFAALAADITGNPTDPVELVMGVPDRLDADLDDIPGTGVHSEQADFVFAGDEEPRASVTTWMALDGAMVVQIDTNLDGLGLDRVRVNVNDGVVFDQGIETGRDYAEEVR
ncbi:hypothetical protein [Agromyces humi]|uniref:hypothetical protein n=1 Tax=Agromyces humi TaxID=1766800 RepID=UPI00135A5EFC|nr:hypothetical protein [Agromyces humi]